MDYREQILAWVNAQGPWSCIPRLAEAHQNEKSLSFPTPWHGGRHPGLPPIQVPTPTAPLLPFLPKECEKMVFSVCRAMSVPPLHATILNGILTNPSLLPPLPFFQSMTFCDIHQPKPQLQSFMPRNFDSAQKWARSRGDQDLINEGTERQT